MKTSLESEILFRTIQFADWMKQHNKTGKSLDVWLLICTFGTQLSLGIIMCRKLAMGGGVSSVLIELPAMLMACTYSISFCNLYTVVEGQKGNISQSLCESICRMPFSLEEYYKEIGNRLKKKAIPVGMAQFAILLLLYTLCLLFWEKVDAEKVHFPQRAAEFFMVLGICIITVAVTFGAMAAGYYIQRRITFKIYYAFLNNTYKRKKIRK